MKNFFNFFSILKKDYFNLIIEMHVP